MVERVLAADVGGTNIRVGIVDRDGRIRSRDEADTPSNGTPDEIADAVSSLALHLMQEHDAENELTSFGLAIPGIIDFSSNRISNSPNLPQLNGNAFAAIVAAKIGLNVFLENDATAAAIGEHYFGAAKNAANVICVTLGTGVGGGLIINGEAFSGADGTAGEVGHICVEPDGPPCGCGSRGCLEQFASATAIVRIANERLTSNSGSTLVRSSELSAKDIFNAAVAADSVAVSVFNTVGYYLGIAFADLVNVLNPEIIVVTGGASDAWRMFIGPAVAEMKKRAFQQPAERVKIVRGELGGDAGILGAAKRTFDHTVKGFS